MSYEAMGEFHDLFMTDVWARLRPAVDDAFCGLGAHDLVVDLGAGTGLGTLAVAEATPARIWAVEPSATMRAILLHRLADAPDLAKRVSVLAEAVPTAFDDIPTPVAGLLGTHMVGHLDPHERSTFFAWLAASLTPEGVALLTHQSADLGQQDAVDEIVEETRVGDHVYRATYSGAGGEFVTVYEVLDETGRVMRSLEASGSWGVVALDELAVEAAAHGLRCRAAAVDGACLVSR